MKNISGTAIISGHNHQASGSTRWRTKGRALLALRNILFVSTGIFLAFLFFELFPDNLVRGGYWEGPYCRWDPLTAYRFISGDIVCSKLFDFRTHLKIGKDGFRCTLPLDKASAVPVRIILLGLSQPFSAGCDEPDSLHQRLTQILSHKYHIKSVCYNLSLPDARILSQLAVIKKYGPVLRPTHVFFWGQEKDTDEERRQRIKTFKERIAYGYNFPVISCMKKSRLLKYSGLVRCLSSETLWKSFEKQRHIPRAIYDIGGLLGLIRPEAKKLNNAKDYFPGIHIHSYKEIGLYCSTIGAHFMASIYKPDPALVYPTDGHMTPAGIQKLADMLAARIARTSR